jgi:dipeptidyl aminopeptidase/acylaminoacyl peptidase
MKREEHVDRDLRQTPLYQEIEAHFQRALAPAFGRISGAADPAPSPDGRHIAFTGSRMERLDGLPATRICLLDLRMDACEEITGGPHDDRLPQWSPDGTRLAFLSDRLVRGQHQLYLLEGDRLGEARATPVIEGTVEYVAWSPDGRSIVLAVAGPGADVDDAHGSGTVASGADDLPSWLPQVDSGVTESQWRRLWLYDVATGASRVLSRPGLNVWEAAWAGSTAIAAVVSFAPDEGAWYSAVLARIDVATGREEIVYQSTRQLGLPSPSPSGRHLALVQAVCSDRTVVAGDLLLVDQAGGAPRVVETGGVDVTHLAWRDDERLFVAGQRGLQSVYGEHNVATGAYTELWATAETSGQRYPLAAPLGRDAFALVLHSYARFPELAVVRDGTPRTLLSLAHAGSTYLQDVGGTLEEVTWTAPDGLEIQGLLACPPTPGPHPLIVKVHGGPVWAYRNTWSMYYVYTPLLVSRGYAVLHPNPRGSGGRGRAFAEMVYGDMGGADTHDILAGIDALVERGRVDNARVGVTGISYGGYMANWLITQTDRFAAAVAMAPDSDYLSAHYTSNIPAFDQLFLQDDPTNLAGRYFSRSPLMYAGRVRTPTLQTTGALDRCTPPSQAIEFHHALLEHGVESALVIYPQEGHGVRCFPAIVDQCTRLVAWFERFMPAR